ncbi:segregation and condensation protein A [Leucothrix pacifica]|uniref:Segregation and condensation protein A n=1 Tax=Leucothrix pacifica TaxID=1247513 RepID=A0A317CFE2_9GAMM|nr:ScpA family protein [Leucothrix pacifica]PWQ95030.1 segregation/condensation protein A [Leucothrix pacifica]
MTTTVDQAAAVPVQQELPLAIVQGEKVTAFPEDLYIPPDALEVILESFEGPLDLLLYLIRRQNLDILDIPIAEITSQYMAYVDVMRLSNLDLAAEYLVMAALLAEIKSRLLLPQRESAEDEEDPRSELVRRLQEYERFKKAAEDVADLPRCERDLVPITITPVTVKKEIPQPDIELHDLLRVLGDVLKRVDQKTHHRIKRETISVRGRMTQVLSSMGSLKVGHYMPFEELLSQAQGRLGVVVTFLAVLELLKSRVIDLMQEEPFAPIYVKPVTAAEEGEEDDEAE